MKRFVSQIVMFRIPKRRLLKFFVLKFKKNKLFEKYIFKPSQDGFPDLNAISVQNEEEVTFNNDEILILRNFFLRKQLKTKWSPLYYASN